MNQPHPANVKSSWYGDSVGHYEGDTLVIDTVGIKADRPYAMVDMFGTPFSAALHDRAGGQRKKNDRTSGPRGCGAGHE